VRRTLAILALTLMVTIPAAAQKVHVDYDRDAVGRPYETFAWYATPDTSIWGEDPLMHSRIKNAIEHYLTDGGLTEVEDDPDLYVTYHTNSKEEVQYSTTYMGYGYGPGWGWDPYWGGSMGGSTTTAHTYERGTLVIDIWDAEKEQIVWRGSASAVVPENPQKGAKLIDKTLKKMIKKYDSLKVKDAK
jgi:hypothetical protein